MSEQWSRRSLLASLGIAALAGCPASQGTDESDDTPQTSQSGTDIPAETPASPTGSPTPASPTETPTVTLETPTPPDSIDTDWPMPAHDPGRSNYDADVPGPTDVIAELWSESTGADLSAPVVADGFVFVGASDGTVRAFDVRTGNIQWRQPVGDTAGTPRVVGDVVYVATDISIHALAVADGTEQWNDGTGPLVDVCVSSHGIYYLVALPSAEKAEVYAVDTADGDERWRAVLEDPWEKRLFVSDDRVFVPTGSYNPVPWMFETESGDLVNEREPGRGADFPGARFYRDGTLYTVDGFFGNVRAYAIEDGTDGWSTGVGKGGTYAVSGGGDRVYVATKAYNQDHARLVGLSAGRGATAWTVSDLSGFPGRPVVGSETVLVRTDKTLRCFDSADGTERWQRPADVVGDTFVVVDDLVVTTQGETVRTLRPP